MFLTKNNLLAVSLLCNIISVITLGIIGIIINFNLMLIGFSGILIANIIIYETYKEKSIFNIMSFFCLFWFFYTNAWLIENYSNEQYLIGITGKVYFLYYLSFVSFYISYKIIRVPKLKKYNFNFNNENGLISIISILTLLVQWVLQLTENYNLLYLGTKQLLYLMSAILYLSYIKTNSKKILILFSLVFIYNVASAFTIIDRSSLLFAVIPFLLIAYKYNKISKWKLIVLGLVGFIILVDFKALMVNIIDHGQIVKLTIGVPEEFFVSFRIASDLISKFELGSFDYLLGESYINGFIATIIPFLNIEPLSVWYVSTYYPELHQNGIGLAFSSVGEAYLNFGIIGVVLYYSFLGGLAKYFHVNKKNNEYALIIYSLLIPLTYKLFRSEFYSILKSHTWFWIVPLIIIYASTKILSRK